MTLLFDAMPSDVSTSSATRLWYTRCPVPTTSGIAQHHRWLHREFAALGIQLDSIRASDDPQIRVSHFDHSQPGMFREGGNVPPLWARARGTDTALVGITWVDEEQLVLVNEDSPIRTAHDLRGRRLGLPTSRTRLVDVGRAEHLRGLLNGLQLGGLTASDVTFIEVDSGELDLRENRQRVDKPIHPGLASLQVGRVDALYAKGATSASLVANHGLRPVLDLNAQPDRLLKVNAGTPRPITVNRTLALERPDLVARYLAVLLRTGEWAKDNPDGVVSAIASETASSELNVRRAYGPDLHKRFEPSLSEDYVTGLTNQKDFLLQHGFIERDIDVSSWIVSEPLALARSVKLAFDF